MLFESVAWRQTARIDPTSNQKFQQWITETIAAVYDQVQAKLRTYYDEYVTISLYRNHAFKDAILQEIMADAAGYAGTEIIRRVVGDSKVKELSLLSVEDKIAAERLLLKLGIQLITNRQHITSGSQLVDSINEFVSSAFSRLQS